MRPTTCARSWSRSCKPSEAIPWRNSSVTRWKSETGKTAMKAHRTERVAEVIREVASETILFELQDPRVKGVTVTRAEVSADLQHAKVYVSLMGSEKEQNLCLHGLRHASGYVQSRVAARVKTR